MEAITLPQSVAVGEDDAIDSSTVDGDTKTSALVSATFQGKFGQKTGQKVEPLGEDSFKADDGQQERAKQDAINVSNERSIDASTLMEDFIMYTDALTPETTELSNLPEILERSGKSKLQWTNYAGFCNALEKCRAHLDVPKGDALDSNAEAACDGDRTCCEGSLCTNAVAVLTILMPYLDVWDEYIRRESTFDIVELFEASTVESADDNNQLHDQQPLLHSWAAQVENNNNLSLYANIVAQFIELATGERFRLSDSRNVMLPALVHSSDAAAEHLCNLYHQHMNTARDGSSDIPEPHGERAMGDGGKDVYSRLASFPTQRQFSRYVPPYLDHSKANAPADGRDACSQIEVTTNTTSMPPNVPLGTDQAACTTSLAAAVIEVNEHSSNNGAIFTERGHSVTHNSILEDDILKVATHVKIVDITKTITKEPSSVERDEDISDDNREKASSVGSDVDLSKNEEDEEDGLHLGFVDRSSFMVPESSSMDMDAHNSESDVADGKRPGHYSPDAEVSPSGPRPSQMENVNVSQQRQAVPFVDASANQEGPVHPLVLSMTTSFALPPAASLGTGLPVECYWDSVLHVRAEGCRKTSLLLTGTQIILEYESDLYEGEELAIKESRIRNNSDVFGMNSFDDAGEDPSHDDGILSKPHTYFSALRPKLLRWAIAEISQIVLRRYRLRDSALEIFFVPSGGSEGSVPSVSLFLDFGPGHVGNAR